MSRCHVFNLNRADPLNLDPCTSSRPQVLRLEHLSIMVSFQRDNSSASKASRHEFLSTPRPLQCKMCTCRKTLRAAMYNPLGMILQEGVSGFNVRAGDWSRAVRAPKIPVQSFHLPMGSRAKISEPRSSL